MRGAKATSTTKLTGAILDSMSKLMRAAMEVSSDSTNDVLVDVEYNAVNDDLIVAVYPHGFYFGEHIKINENGEIEKVNEVHIRRVYFDAAEDTEADIISHIDALITWVATYKEGTT